MVLVTSGLALGGARISVGGQLDVVLPQKTTAALSALADSPVEASLATLVATPLCRLVDTQRVSETELRLVPKPGLVPSRLVEHLANVRRIESVYTALSKVIRRVESIDNMVSVEVSDGLAVELEASLCHPLFAFPQASFERDSEGAFTFRAVESAPGGRPWLNSINVVSKTERDAQPLKRPFSSVTLSTAKGDLKTSLFATYLVWSAKVAPHFGAAARASVDLDELVRYFAKGNAEPLELGLPLFFSGGKRGAQSPREKDPSTLSTETKLTLAFDEVSAVQRAVAERLQIKLKKFGYRLVLKAVSGARLRAELSRPEAEVSLQTVLLPPAVTLARSVVSALAPSPSASAAPHVLPLFSQGVSIKTAPEVQRLTVDAQGLVNFENAFLEEP